MLPIARRAYAEVMGDQTGTGLAPRLVVRVKALHNGMGLVHLHVRSGNARNAHKLLERSMDAAMEALRQDSAVILAGLTTTSSDPQCLPQSKPVILVAPKSCNEHINQSILCP